MASGGHILQQQKPHVETRIKGLVNDNLKDICRAYGMGVTGTKAVLQTRCIKSESETVVWGRCDDHSG